MRIVLCVALLGGGVALARSGAERCLEIHGVGSDEGPQAAICWDLARPKKLGGDFVAI